MKESVNSSRRHFIKTAAVVSTAPFSVLGGCSVSEGVDRKLKFTSLIEGVQEAERLVSANSVAPSSVLSLPQTLVHCAQSIEFSMRGFPKSKSSIFQNTLGSAAFGVFSWRGRMSHDLAEAIPGAPPLDSETSVEEAMLRLQLSVDAFTQTQNELQPHFAYGALDKEEYEFAHAIHLANHFSIFDA